MIRIKVNKKSYFIVWVFSEFCFGDVSSRGVGKKGRPVLKWLHESSPRVLWDVVLTVGVQETEWSRSLLCDCAELLNLPEPLLSCIRQT